MEETNNTTQLLSGNEMFTLNGTPQGFDVRSFWRFQFSNLSDMQGEVGEFVVSMALNNVLPNNKCGWTHWDINYGATKVEVKTTSYYQPWRSKKTDAEGNEVENISEHRAFSIRKSHKDWNDPTSELIRHSDIYIFVLDIGKTETTANPLHLENWRFWVIPTKLINDKCNDNKSISLGKVKRLAKMRHFPEDGVGFADLRQAVDNAISEL